MIVRELITKLGFQVDTQKIRNFDEKIGELKKSSRGLVQNMAGVARGVRNTGLAMTAVASIPIALLGKSMIQSATDAEETESKFKTVFQGIENDATSASENLVNNFGLSRKASQQLLGDTGDLLSGFNFSREMALDFSKQVNELAVDLASFTNFSGGAEGASQALTKALLGERESIKSLGIAILEKDVKDRVALNRAKGIRFETERQEKAFATLQLAQEQSKNAIGDFARTQNSTANRMRTFKARLNDLSVSFGKLLLPAVNKILGVFLKLTKFLDGLSKPMKILILVIGGITFAIGPLLLILGTLGLAITGLIPLMSAFGTATNVAFAPVWAIIGIVVGVIAVLGLLALAIEDVWIWMNGGDSVIGKIFGKFEGWGNLLKKMIGWLKDFIFYLDDLSKIIKNFSINSFLKIMDKIQGFGKSIKDYLSVQTPNFAVPGGVLGANFGAVNKGNTVSNQVSVKSDIKLELPAGTTAEQKAIIEGSARDMVQKEISKAVTSAINSNPRSE